MTLVAPPAPPSPPSPGKHAEHVYPTLRRAQVARLAARGRQRQVERGEVLQQAGEPAARLLAVVAGRFDVVRPSAAEEVVVSFSPGMFTGEVTLLSGRRGLAQIRAGVDGEVIEVGRDDLLALIQTDVDLSAILMRAFILRRGEDVKHGKDQDPALGEPCCQRGAAHRATPVPDLHPPYLKYTDFVF